MAQTPASEEVRLELNVVVPVPLSPARRRQRGYNQAELLASEIASILGLPVETAALERRARSTTQTTLHPDQRRANVAGAFHLREQGSTLIAAKHVLLVDDVWTTGATARACAETLLAGGARGISVLTFARAMPEFESNAKRIEQLANY